MTNNEIYLATSMTNNEICEQHIVNFLAFTLSIGILLKVFLLINALLCFSSSAINHMFLLRISTTHIHIISISYNSKFLRFLPYLLCYFMFPKMKHIDAIILNTSQLPPNPAYIFLILLTVLFQPFFVPIIGIGLCILIFVVSFFNCLLISSLPVSFLFLFYFLFSFLPLSLPAFQFLSCVSSNCLRYFTLETPSCNLCHATCNRVFPTRCSKFLIRTQAKPGQFFGLRAEKKKKIRLVRSAK